MEEGQIEDVTACYFQRKLGQDKVLGTIFVFGLRDEVPHARACISQSQLVRATAATMLMQKARTGAALALIWAASADAFLAPMGGVAAPHLLRAQSRRGACHGKVAMAAATASATGALREARAAKDMRFNKLGDSDLLVSEVCLGISSFPPGTPLPGWPSTRTLPRREAVTTALEATHGQNDSFFSQFSFK